MKDKRIEEQFKEYFEGVDLPELPNDIVADAKKSVKRRDTRLPRFAKFASIAASFVLVFAVAAVLIARSDFSAVQPGDDSANSTPPPSNTAPSEPSAPSTYAVSELRFDEENAYTLSKVDKSLTFIENLAYTRNAEVCGVYTSHFADEEIAFVYAEVTLVSGTRYDAQIFVEYSEQTFEPLKDYSGGAAGKYRGISYYITKGVAENGEPFNKLLAEKGGVKYYFNIQSSDENSYLKCLELLFQN